LSKKKQHREEMGWIRFRCSCEISQIHQWIYKYVYAFYVRKIQSDRRSSSEYLYQSKNSLVILSGA